jgi:hypothetical protein
MRARALVSPAERVLRESDTDVWPRWSADRERRELRQSARATVATKHAADEPIYPRECAERIAVDIHHAGPDCRYVWPTLGSAWGRLLKAQPELSPELTRQREAATTAALNALPRSQQGAVRELRTRIDLLLMAHEWAAFACGFEAGWLDERARLKDAR